MLANREACAYKEERYFENTKEAALYLYDLSEKCKKEYDSLEIICLIEEKKFIYSRELTIKQLSQQDLQQTGLTKTGINNLSMFMKGNYTQLSGSAIIISPTPTYQGTLVYEYQAEAKQDIINNRDTTHTSFQAQLKAHQLPLNKVQVRPYSAISSKPSEDKNICNQPDTRFLRKVNGF